MIDHHRNRSPAPEEIQRCALRLLHARHLAAYRWALPFVAGRRVLEVGTNVGYGTELLAAEAETVVGVGLSLDHARAARARARVEVLRADGQRLPFREGSFDVAVSFQVVEHVWDVGAFLHELRRVVRPGGVVLLSTPQRRGRLLHNQVPWNDEHLREFDEQQLDAALSDAFGARCQVFGLHGDELASALERWRVAQDPIAHYLAGPWARPVRALGRRLHAWRRRGLLPGPTDLQKVAGEPESSLVRRFLVDPGRPGEALDLLALCPVGDQRSRRGTFDPGEYWRERLGRCPDLRGTGTSGHPLSWQRWLYRGKVRAIRRLLGRQRVRLDGGTVLDLGCGTGVFEDQWEAWGARRADGIDIVPDMIERLQRAHPARRYVCADLARDPAAIEAFEPADLVTALDVLYHIVDDEAARATVRALTGRLRPGGWFLFSDACIERAPAPHVRFRSIHQWEQLLGAIGLTIVDREPTFVVNNLEVRGIRRAPYLVGALQHVADGVVLRTTPSLANNWMILARRDVP